MSKIAYLGDKYTHTFAAACTFLGEGDTAVGFPTIYASVSSVAEGKCDLAVAPVENSCGGSVADTLDALWALRLYVRAETVLKVPQNLIVRKGTKKEEIRTVYSHPQALAQCDGYLRESFPNANVIAVESTAAALAAVSKNSEAAIARLAGNGQEILEAEIEDVKNNATRFLLLGSEPCLEGGKCSVVFETKNEPGALVAPLNRLHEFGLNMTRIESRPHKSKLGRYIFFVDFDSGLSRDRLAQVIAALTEDTLSLKFLGQYPTVSAK